MKFSSRKDLLFSSTTIGICLLLLGLLVWQIYQNGYSEKMLWPGIIIIACVAFILWLFLDTRYEVNATHFIYRSGPIKGSIAVERIREVIVGRTMWTGLRPATARNGIIVKYDQYNEVYISPNDNQQFVERLKEVNHRVQVSG